MPTMKAEPGRRTMNTRTPTHAANGPAAPGRMATDAADEAPVRAGRLALALLALCALLPALGTSIANVALPTLAAAFNADFDAVQWVVLSFLLANTGAVLVVGRLADRWGPLRLLRAGLLLFSGASGLCALAPSLGWLLAARALQGLAAAVLMVLSMALVVGQLPQGQAGRGLGLLGTMSAVGTALGPALGGLLISAFGWRAIFVLLLLLGLVTRGLLSPGRIHHPPAAATRDVTLAPAGLAPRSARPWFRQPRLREGLWMSLLVAAVMMGTLVVGPFYLAQGLGLEPARVGLVMAIGPVASALAGVPAGRWVDRLGPPRSLRLALAPLAVAAVALVLAPVLRGPLAVAGYAVPLVMLTAAYALFQAANNTALLTGLPAHRRAAVSGLLNLARNLGLMGGAAMLGAVYAAAAVASGASSPMGATSGLQHSFGVAAVLIGIAVAIALRRPPPTGRVEDVAIAR